MRTEGKKAANPDAAWDIQETYTDKPHGWLQWKGSKICMDFYCACGTHGHIDADFVYYVQCAHCGRVYFMNGHVEAIELTEPHAVHVTVCRDEDAD